MVSHDGAAFEWMGPTEERRMSDAFCAWTGERMSGKGKKVGGGERVRREIKCFKLRACGTGLRRVCRNAEKLESGNIDIENYIKIHVQALCTVKDGGMWANASLV